MVSIIDEAALFFKDIGSPQDSISFYTKQAKKNKENCFKVQFKMEIPKWHAICTLSALRFSYKHWPLIEKAGGAQEFLKLPAKDIKYALCGDSKRVKVFSKENKNPEEIIKDAILQSKTIKAFLKKGGHILGLNGPKELGPLKRAPLAPLCAFLMGDTDIIFQKPQVGIVGTRHPTKKGFERSFHIAHELAKKGFIIVSGGAQGVDIAAHKGALSAGGDTIVVQGNLVDERGNINTYRTNALQPKSRVHIISAFGPWTKSGNYLFAERNKYVAALADAIIVTEGGEKSGSLHTANFAKNMQTAVWAIPGDPENPYAAAANILLQDGHARAFYKIDAFLDSLNTTSNDKKSSKKVTKRIDPKEGISDEKCLEIIDIIHTNGGKAEVDLICKKAKLSIPSIQQKLFELEIMGKIHKEGAELVLTHY
ncbi:DNA-protecting protein DprA [Sulfobacillus acidophilus]|uniref:DNA-protecting protein DprA n=1 Tax=Sulfobacillus acidophilus TaxID=53633 RepID=A0ABS3AW88_9FIRM|nr:DNA-protecting protein DprA [Sulfobacillus acidophilus]